ncbi:hypothetical protein [Bradyrhizobium embrapense]
MTMWLPSGSADVCICQVRERTLLIALCIFVPTLLAIACEMMSRGISERGSALFAFLWLPQLPSIFARRISVARWPELVKKPTTMQ